MKNLYHITEDVSRASGGIRTVVLDLKRQFPESLIWTTNNDEENSKIVTFPCKGPWLYSNKISAALADLNNHCMLHIHGVWMHAQYAAAKVAAQKKIPFIVSPHGMFEPWLWNEGTLKKKLYFKLLSSSAFAKAKYIHAITPQEQINLQKLFPETPVICIPNAITISTPVVKVSTTRPYFLFLGRLHQKKGLELLIKTFANLSLKNFDLKIAGSKNAYGAKMMRLASELKSNSIQFLGPIRGAAKDALFRNAFCFVAPSYSEVVGMVNLEAAMQATPVITTRQTGLLESWNTNGGMLIEPARKDLNNALVSASQWSVAERNKRGAQLREFVIREYSWKSNRKKWVKAYTD